MNQDQVKAILSDLDNGAEDFTLVFSGKTSKKVNGLYKPDTREIILHNRNFDSDEQLIYTAIHEFAHHLHFTRSPVPVTSRSHTIEFRSILHGLLRKAEETGVYTSAALENPELQGAAERIRSRFLEPNGALMKAFGRALFEAQEICRRCNARFEDFVERTLSMDMSVAKSLMQFHSLDLPDKLGYEGMKTVVGFRKPTDRERAEQALLAGESPDTVKAALRTPPGQDDPVARLTKEKRRLESTIAGLNRRLEEVQARLESLDGGAAET